MGDLMPSVEINIKTEKNNGDYPFYMKWILTAEIKYGQLDEEGILKLTNCSHFDIINVTRTSVTCLVNEEKDLKTESQVFKLAVKKCVPVLEKSRIKINPHHLKKFI